jgi:methionyl-tRNA formyltransferase
MSAKKTDEIPKTVLLRHQDSQFDKEVIGRWLAAETKMMAEIVIESDRWQQVRTLQHEYRRSGLTGLADALAFWLHYNINLSDKEEEKIESLTQDAINQYPESQIERHVVEDPNSKRTVSLLRELEPDVMLARCKFLLDGEVFAEPTNGTFVLHPGICPEYRNQHGCFWAMTNGDDQNVGYTLLQIDKGIDTGRIFAQNGATFNPQKDEHIYIQLKTVKDNLDEIGETLKRVHRGKATPMDRTGRPSAIWGMPKLSAWLTWKRRVKKFDITHVNSDRE